jgi:eukaryotic-like serine/threonine-protein kinase
VDVTTYQMKVKIGSGGFGEVWECVREDDGQIFARKILDSTLEQDIRRFRREVRMQASLQHPNVVPIVAHDVEATPPWMMMPKAETNLRDYLETHKGTGELWIIRDVGLGLQYAHTNGIVHRDLKPENVLLFKAPGGKLTAAIADFGLGVKVDRSTTRLTRTQMGLGTIGYVAPEQVQNAKDVDARADIYCLGKLLYEVLTGDYPYPDMDFTKVPSRYAYVIRRACRKDPAERYGSVAEMFGELAALADGARLLTKAAERIQDAIKTLAGTPTPTRNEVEPLLRLLVENADNMEVLLRQLPFVPEPLLRALFAHFPSDMEALLESYEKAITGTLGFDYCDTVADFYAKVFGITGSIDLRSRILERLALVGWNHNRWHVGGVLATLVAGLTDPALVVAFGKFLRENPDAAAWCETYLQRVSMPDGIVKVLRGKPKANTPA